MGSKPLAVLVMAILWVSPPARAMDPAMAQAEGLLRAGKTDQAELLIAGYLTSKENAAAYIDVGNLFARLKKWDKSVHYLDIATKRNERSALAWYELGL